MPDADIVIVDEAHHARSRTYQQIIEAHPKARLIGLTATPCRGDGRGLGNTFDSIVQCPQVHEMIAQGYLVPTKVYAPSTPDLKGIKVARGDYAENQLAERMDRAELIGDIVTHWHKLAERRKTIVFATSVEHSVHLRDEFRKSGVQAEHVDGETPKEERDLIIKQLASGAVDLVTNCAVFTEGFDEPSISCIVLARPTKSFGLYKQMVGRVLRPYPDKANALVLDHAGCTFEHGFAEEPVQWSLHTDARAASLAQLARNAGSVPKLTECPECKAVRWGGKPCTACGWRPQPKPRSVEIIEGDLREMDRKTRNVIAEHGDERRQFYGQLLQLVDERSYNPGWAAHKYREKYGVWPDRQWRDRVPITQSTLSWVRSRQIAWSRAQAKLRVEA